MKVRYAHASRYIVAAQTDSQVWQDRGDAPTMEVRGTGADVRVDGVQLIREGGGHTGGGVGIVKIPGDTLGPNKRWLTRNPTEHK